MPYLKLLSLLSLPHALSSDDTYRRALNASSPASFEAAFQSWVKSITSCLVDDIIPIDGTQIRGTFPCCAENVIHQEKAWSCSHQLALGQVKTDDKSNEITAIPVLLKPLDIEGVTC